MWLVVTKGGIFIWPLLICSILALALIIERGIALNKFRQQNRSFWVRFNGALSRGQLSELLYICEYDYSLLARIFLPALRYAQCNSITGKTKETFKQLLQETALAEVPVLERHLKTLSTIAHIAPLLGFLGTVTGMIKAFQTIQHLAARGEVLGPGNLAGGIWEALITTAVGLVIAIPTYIAYNYYTSYIDATTSEMEKHTREMVESLSNRGASLP